jgi:hypothetical protein
MNFDTFFKKFENLKPIDLFIDDLYWKYLLWGIHLKKNIFIFGYPRCGKTYSVIAASKILGYPLHTFNCGGGQDARATLIGNTTFKKETGTIFFSSPFINAIQTKNSIILLDELTRGNHDFWNILLPAIDYTQRKIRLDENENSPVIDVDPSVTFIATANIGSEFTATRILDKSILSRFTVKMEFLPLNKNELLKLIKTRFPNIKCEKGSTIWDICEIYERILLNCNGENPKLSTLIPPGIVLEMAQMVYDGFSLNEIADLCINTEYTDDGGIDSERTFVRQIVDAFIVKSAKNPLKNVTNK